MIASVRAELAVDNAVLEKCVSMNDPLVITVWKIDLRAGERRYASCWEWLDPQERDRVGRFRFEGDRRRFVLRRAAYRQILGQAVNCPGDKLEFGSGPHGKPFLRELSSSVSVEFNSSHSGEFALLAVAKTAAIGVDIERLRFENINTVLLERTLSPQEMGAYEVLEPEARTGAFFQTWTRKEAVLKAAGVGLSISPRDFSVAGMRGLLGRWSVFDLDFGPSYAAAVAADRTDCGIEQRAWHWV